MGSIITRNVIKTSSKNYEKVILSGFPNYNKFTPCAILLSNIVKLFEGKHAHSRLLEKGALGPFEKAIKDRKTNLDWLSINWQGFIIRIDKHVKPEQIINLHPDAVVVITLKPETTNKYGICVENSIIK
jgi:hypothetical protein